jgi:beta-aspartyl-dipeptidase (metallo-type)
MFKLLKNGHCLVPEDIGINDILIAWDKICGIKSNISPLNPWDTELIDCQGCFICPGIIDGHVHITGGGGEGGPESRIPELMLSEIFEPGIKEESKLDMSPLEESGVGNCWSRSL